MSVRAQHKAIFRAASVACAILPAWGPSFAQPAASELPTIEVTTPSPVVRPARTASQRPQATAASQPLVEGVPDVPAGITLDFDDETFAAVSVTTARDIDATPGATITDAIFAKPGISGSTFTPGANRPIIRGVDGYRIRTQEDGIGTHDVATLSEDHAVPIDPASADRIEVVRGPATLRFGSQATGGVVAVENERVPTRIPLGGVSGSVYGGMNTVDEGRNGGFKATAGTRGVAIQADGFWREANDYDTPRGTVVNSFVESQGGAMGGSLIGSDGFVGVSVSRVDSFYGIAGEDVAIDLIQDKVLSRGEWRLRTGGIDAIRYWFGASDYEHKEVSVETGDIGSLFTNKEQEARIEVQHLPIGTAFGQMTGALGVQYGHRNLHAQSFEGDGLLDPAETNSFAAFLFEEFAVTETLRLQAAGRLEHTTVDGIGISDYTDFDAPVAFAGERAFTPGSISLGALYRLPGDIVARVTGQYVERAPDAAELFSKGLHEATKTFELGNPFLGKEKAKTAEFGLKRSTGAFRFDTSVYFTQYSDFIFKDLTNIKCEDEIGTCNDPGVDELDLLVFGQRDAHFYGAELSGQLDISPIWRGIWGIESQYDFVRAEFDNGENVQRIPPHRLGGGVYYRDEAWFARAAILHAFDQNQLGANEIATPGYTLVSAEMTYTVEGKGLTSPGYTVGIKGENLADDEALNHASFRRRDEILMPGASVRLFGRVDLN